jgi:hypothetical protein
MLELAQNFELLAVRFNPFITAGLGMLILIVGLFVWLGGLGIRRLLLTIAGLLLGGICGIFVVGKNLITTMTLAIIGAFAAIIFQRLFIAILTAALAAALAFVFLAGPYLGKPSAPPENQLQTRKLNEPYSIQQSLQTIKAYKSDFTTRLKNLYAKLPLYALLIIAATAAVSILAGLLFYSFTSALCWATLGTILTFTGMISLLLYKGAMPITAICTRTTFYTVVFAAMIAFGTIVQSLLCPRAQKYLKRKKPPKPKEEPKEKPLSWRGH